jgi:Beta-eliminating lyase
MKHDDSQQFASDNYSGICPEAWAAMEAANRGHAPAYGEDAWTKRAADAFRTLFETDCDVFFAFNGTAANALALAALCQSYHSVICADSAHIETDECGAPEFFSNGSKLLTVRTEGGKLTPEAIRALATNRSDIHFPRPRVVTITQPTETGQVYSVAEIQALSATCWELGLALHMDGSRFANACASLGCSPADVTWRAGVDVLCFGGTKNGMHAGEAVVFFDRHAGERRVAAERRPRQRLRPALRRFRLRAAGGADPVSRGGQRRLPDDAASHHGRSARPRLAVLHLHRRRGAVHVRLGREAGPRSPADRRPARAVGCGGLRPGRYSSARSAGSALGKIRRRRA